MMNLYHTIYIHNTNVNRQKININVKKMRFFDICRFLMYKQIGFSHLYCEFSMLTINECENYKHSKYYDDDYMYGDAEQGLPRVIIIWDSILRMFSPWIRYAKLIVICLPQQPRNYYPPSNFGFYFVIMKILLPFFISFFKRMGWFMFC